MAIDRRLFNSIINQRTMQRENIEKYLADMKLVGENATIHRLFMDKDYQSVVLSETFSEVSKFLDPVKLDGLVEKINTLVNHTMAKDRNNCGKLKNIELGKNFNQSEPEPVFPPFVETGHLYEVFEKNS